MLYYEIESYFSDPKKTDELLSLYEPIFMDITTIEEDLATHKITTVKEIKDSLNEITVLENKCSAVYVIADTYKTGEETRAKHSIIKKQVVANAKVNVSQAKEEASGEVQYLRRVRNIFQMYKDRAMNVKSTLKATYYNNAEYKSEDNESTNV